MRQQKQFYQNKVYFQNYKESGWEALVQFLNTDIGCISVPECTMLGLNLLAMKLDNAKQEITVAFSSGKIVRWNFKTQELKTWMVPFDDEAIGMSIFENKIVVGTPDNFVEVYDLVDDGHGTVFLDHQFLMSAQVSANMLVEWVFANSNFVAGCSRNYQRAIIWDRETKAQIDIFSADSISITGSVVSIGYHSSVRIFRLVAFGGSYQRVDEKTFNANVLLLQTIQGIPEGAAIACHLLQSKGYYTAALFREGKSKRGNRNDSKATLGVPPFDILVIWNHMKPDSPVRHRFLLSSGQSIKHIEIDESLEKVVCMLSDGKFSFVSTTTGKEYVSTEDLAPYLVTAQVASDRVFLATMNSVKMIPFNNDGVEAQGQRARAILDLVLTTPDPILPTVNNPIDDVWVYLRAMKRAISKASSQELPHQMILERIKEYLHLYNSAKKCRQLNALAMYKGLSSTAMEYESLVDSVNKTSTWIQEAFSNMNNISFNEALVYLTRADDIQRKQSKSADKHPWVKKQMEEAVPQLRHKILLLAGDQLKNVYKKIENLGDITPSNIVPAEEMLAILQRSSLFQKGRTEFMWVQSTQEYEQYQKLLQSLSVKIADYHAIDFKDRLNALTFSFGSDTVTIGEFWNAYDNIAGDVSQKTRLLEHADPQNVLSLKHELKTVFDDMCLKHTQILEKTVNLIRDDLRDDDMTLKKLLNIRKKIETLAQDDATKSLERRNPNYYGHIIELLRVHLEDCIRRIEPLKRTEHAMIASLMEQIGEINITPTCDRDEMYLKLEGFKSLLDKYSGGNAEWISIGRGRIEELEKQLFAPKEHVLTQDDFFMEEPDMDDLQDDDEDMIDDDEELVEEEDDGDEDPEDD
eukprot:TRINITY_DN9390_c0_g2_i1.p1 TRINITY_DN9390_c0_g2~~TRINITY_DN9390_c0_g2_i1.p1  ORF type:complete len:957 (-),score=268.85 TRINITY_DN9390_c0_g2_i1:53-2641(-)